MSNSRVATLVVGPESKEFSVHQHLLCESSDFFKAALEGQLQESASTTVRLPEDKFEIIDYFVEWLYTQRSPPFEAVGLTTTLSTREEANRQYEGVIELYEFAQRVICLELKKDVIDKMFTTFQTVSLQVGKRWFPIPKTINQLYETTTSTSPFRRFFVHWCCFGFQPTFWKRAVAQELLYKTPAFAVDAAIALALRCSDEGKQLNFSQLTASYFYDDDMKNIAGSGDDTKTAESSAQAQEKKVET